MGHTLRQQAPHRLNPSIQNQLPIRDGKLIELVKIVILTSSQTRTAGAWFAFEKAAPGCAHNLCACCAQIQHLPGVLCFVRCTRHRTKPIYTLFRRARRNSTRFFDSLTKSASHSKWEADFEKTMQCTGGRRACVTGSYGGGGRPCFWRSRAAPLRGQRYLSG